MATAPELIDPFHRSLHERLIDNLSNRINQLADGSASQSKEGVSTVAEKYAAQVSYIKALRDVLALCEELERERYGVRKEEEDY